MYLDFTGSQASPIALYSAYKLVDIGIDTRHAVRFGRLAAGTSRVAWAGLSTVSGGLSVASVAFDVVTLPIDLFVIVKGAYDIHKYRTGRGTNSNRACQLEAMIQKLEEHKNNVLKIKEMFWMEI